MALKNRHRKSLLGTLMPKTGMMKHSRSWRRWLGNTGRRVGPWQPWTTSQPHSCLHQGHASPPQEHCSQTLTIINVHFWNWLATGTILGGPLSFITILKTYQLMSQKTWTLLHGGQYVFSFFILVRNINLSLPKNHATVYPTLAKIAKDICSVPASSVPCKHLFSTGAEIATDCQACLGAEAFESS